jgi:hypothetical protein
MCMQYSDGCCGPEAPHPDGLVTAARGEERVVQTDRHVGHLPGVSPHRGQQTTGHCTPDLHQVVISALRLEYSTDTMWNQGCF